MCIPSITMLYEKPKKVNDIKGSSLLSPAHGRVGARATSFSFCISVPPPSGGRKRWAGFNPQNPLDFAQNGFGFHPTNTTKVNIEFNFMLEKNEKTKNLKERIARLKGFL